MRAHISMEYYNGQPFIKCSIQTENDRLKYHVYVIGSERIGLPYLLKDLGVTHISFSQNINEEWYAALALLYNEFEAI